jgi:hypothetical protein
MPVLSLTKGTPIRADQNARAVTAQDTKKQQFRNDSPARQSSVVG